MVLKKLMNGALSRFKSDEKGSLSMVWAVSAAVLLGAMGAALDYALLSSANARAQAVADTCLLYTSPSPRDATLSRMPSSA